MTHIRRGCWLAGSVLSSVSSHPYDPAGIKLKGNLARGSSGSSMRDAQLLREISVQPVLMNKQEETCFALAHSSKRQYSRPFQITTVGTKGSIKIKVSLQRRWQQVLPEWKSSTGLSSRWWRASPESDKIPSIQLVWLGANVSGTHTAQLSVRTPALPMHNSSIMQFPTSYG